MTAFLMIFRRFPKISQNCSEGQTNVPEHFPRISENFRRCPKTFEEDPKIFRWCTNKFKYNLRDKLDISEIFDIFTCEDIVSFLSISYHSLYHWLLYNNIIFAKGGLKYFAYIILRFSFFSPCEKNIFISDRLEAETKIASMWHVQNEWTCRPFWSEIKV